MKLELIHNQPQKVIFKNPLIFLHGAFSGAWCWEEHFLEYFSSKGFESMALNLRGHGENDFSKLMDQHSLKEYRDDLYSAIEKCKEPPVIIGHSMGDYLLQQILHDKSSRASVLMASPPPSGLLSIFLNLYIHNPVRFHQWGWGTWLDCFKNIGHFHDNEKHFMYGTVYGSTEKKYRHRYGNESKKALWEMYWAISFSPSKHRKPMLVLGGSEDRLIQESSFRQTANHYGAEYQLIPGAGHSMMLGPEWQKSATALEQWLKGNIS